MEIPQEYLRLHPSEVLVLLDSQGHIVESSYKPAVFQSALDHIHDHMTAGADIRGLFNVPRTSLHNLLNEENAALQYPNLPGVFDFSGGQEEFHTLLAVAHISVFRAGEGILGVVRLSRFFMRINVQLQRLPLICSDLDEKIIGFNRAFLSALGQPVSDPRSLLNRPLSDFLLPTPAQIQEQETRAFIPPDSSEWRAMGRLGITPEWESMEEKALQTLAFPETVRLHGQDVRVRLEIGEWGALPCVIFGEKIPHRDVYAYDADGYLFGPARLHDRMVLKKQGDTAFLSALLPAGDRGGTYEFIKCGLTFSIVHNGRTLCMFHDFEGMARERAQIFLFRRPGEKTRLKWAELSVRDRERPLTVLNRFTALSNNPDRQFAIRRLPLAQSGQQAFNFDTFQLEDLSDIRHAVQALERSYRSALEREKEAVRLLREYNGGETEFVCNARSMQQVRDLAERAAESDSTVLIQGQTGTGKEVMARYIHEKSHRSRMPFLHVDCAALPPSLLESILFGHEKGAFTGAVKTSQGLFRQAGGGTLFIDEVHNIPLEVQAKLLGFLQDQTLTPVGGNRSVKLDVRIVLATNADLKGLVRQGRFREDLYYRIAVVVLELPPLKERREDIPLLVRRFLDEFNRKYNKSVSDLTAAAYRRLHEHDWPGNIRELRNVLEQACIFTGEGEVDAERIQIKSAPVAALSRRAARKPLRSVRLSKEEMEALLKKHQGYVSRIAEELSVTRPTLYRFFKRHGFRPGEFR